MLNFYRRSGEFRENRRPLFYFVLMLAVFAAVVGLAPAASATGPDAGPDAPPVHRPHGAGWFTCQHDVHANLANNLIARNNGEQPMCIGSYTWGDKFTVYHSSVTRDWADFPNIYTGCEMDGSLPQLCTQGRATPVRVSSIRSDVSSVSYYYPYSDFAGNAAYDIWFDRTGRRPQGRDDGAEIMIWLGSNGIGAPAFSRVVTIDGIQWGYITWGAFHSGHGWNYIRYWRLSGSSNSSAVTLNLVPFYKDAERARRLSSHWYLTGTEFGFETCFGGKGLEVRKFSDRLVTR
jgi:Glycosyl hydrolase family 12